MSIAVILLIAVVSVVTFWLGCWMGRPNSPSLYYIGMYREHRPEFVMSVEEIESGQGRLKSDGAGYYGSEQLESLGVRYIVKEGNCIYFRFAGGAVSNVYELIYSPNDFDSLPSLTPRDEFNRKTFAFERIEKGWFYRSWDQ